MRNCPFRLHALGILLSISSIARADPGRHVDVVCDAQANMALVRFATSYDNNPVQYPTLPRELDKGLSANSGSDRTDCTLRNGTTIRVRGGSEQAFGYGAGGADPPAFFSLWVDRRRVLSRETWLPGYESLDNHAPTYDGVLIEPGRLTICGQTDDRPQECKPRALDLKAVPIDRVEYGGSNHKPPAGTVVPIAKGAANQQFCSRYLAHLAPYVDERLRGADSPFDLDWSPQDAATEDERDGRPQSGVVELSPGTTRRLMTWGGENHYFDGDVAVLAPSTMTARDIVSIYPFKDIGAWRHVAAPAGVILVSGGQPKLYPEVSTRYVHLVPQRVEGTLYFLAYPTNMKVHPTAALVKPLANRGFFTICAFDRADPHF